MKTTYLAHTPYHVILAATMARSECDDTELILIQDTNSDRLAEEVTKADEFTTVNIRPGLYAETNFLRRRVILLRNILYLHQYLRRSPPDTLVVFNDRRPDVQAALHACQTATSVYAEDGSNAYSSFTHESYSGVSLAARKLLYGYWYTSPEVLGTTPWIEEIRATHPDNLRSELQGYPVDCIPPNKISELQSSDWVRDYLSAVGITLESIHELDIVLALAHSSFASSVDGYIDAYTAILDNATDADLNVGIKYHPRDLDGYLSTREYDGVFVLPNSVPFELISLGINPQATIIGDVSTVLLTAKMISEVRVVSIASLLSIDDRILLNNLSGIGVETYSSWEDISKIIN